MYANSSSSTNSSSSLPSSPLCLVGWWILLSSTVLSAVLLLPLCLAVLYLGLQRWWRQRRRRSGPSAAAARNMSEAVTYNVAVMELMGVLASILYACALLHPGFMMVASNIMAFIWYGQMMFPVLTCVEHYLAVVQPLTYVRLRQAGGVRIRNTSILFIWLLGPFGVVLFYFTLGRPLFIYIQCTIELVAILAGMTFFSLSVLWALTRPRPGEATGDGVRVHRSKRNALRTITVIMVTLLLRFGGNLVSNLVQSSPSVGPGASCVVRSLLGWFNLPSGLVLPLLFLHRAGKLPGWTHRTGST